ncbi:hypothetical protein HDU99_001612 [Rhizoclosmatium hyalinum]|nr:hypothetical protein HDU99_001612 [Rhizoclosmatium hyalinum]
MSVTIKGGTFERFLPPGQDCVADFVVSDPSPAQLRCLTFSLPATVTVPADNYNKNNTLANLMTFTDTSPACGGSNLLERLSTVYGYTVTDIIMDGFFSNDVEPYDFTYLRGGFDISPPSGGKRRDLDKTCVIQWIPTYKLVSNPYILEYKSPVCGASAPKLIDDSQENRATLSSSLVFNDVVYFPNANDEAHTILSKVYGVSAETVKVQMISNVKFNITVTSNADKPNAENSCVYTFVPVDRRFTLHTYSLVDYDIGKQALLPGANLADGCIDEAILAAGIEFKNSNDECGDYAASSRFQRYFGGSIEVNFNYLDEANLYVNFTVSNGGRRAQDDITFHYFDKSFLPTTTIASTVFSTALSTSTVFSTALSTSDVVPTTLSTSTLSVASTTSVITGTTVIDTLSTSIVNDSASISTAVASVSTSTLIPSVSTPRAIASVKGSAVTTIADSIASNAVSTTVAIPTVVPTGYVAPTGNSGPTAYGVPAAANNIYKSASAGVVGLVSAFIVSLLFAF